MARRWENKFGTILNNLEKDIKKKNKRRECNDLETPIIQRFCGSIWATAKGCMVYVIPERKFTLPYEIKEDMQEKMKSISLSVMGGDKKELVFDGVTSRGDFKKIFVFHAMGAYPIEKVYLDARLVKKFGDVDKLYFASEGRCLSPVGIFKRGQLVGVVMPLRVY